ncbi:ion transport domain-containing protein [Ceratobasidium sp. AG-Ba]|nr:ion transport domain-containing protein [Ceratobasidium sp. AG-Ba]
MAPPRTPARDRTPQRIITDVTAVSNSVQPSPIAPRRSSSEGLSRRSSWNRAVPDPLSSQAPLNFGRTDPDVGHFDTQSIVDEPEMTYNTVYSHQPSHSLASIDSPTHYATDIDDSTRLTSAAAPPWRGDTESVDQGDEVLNAEWGTAGPSTPRRSGATSPMRSATLKAVSKHLRRVSLRVVNLAGVQLEDKPVPRTPDREREDLPRLTPDKELGVPSPEPTAAPEDELDRRHHMMLRGRTLGIFGPDSRIRQAMRATLLWTWTEPIILVLIFANAVFLTTQAWYSVYVREREDGYFKMWEDYALFILFCIFTVEMIARIIVSGFVLDPEIKPSSVKAWIQDLAPGDNFAARARSVRRKVFEQRAPYSQAAANSTTALDDKSSAQKTTLSLALVSQVNLVAAHGSRSQPEVTHPATPGPSYPPHPPSQHVQSASGTWYLHQTTDTPFQLAVARQRILAEQSSTYLRHSWNRTDFVAVCAFWIMFGLAVSGMETQPNAHIYVFRALSVLRTARLLAVTKGTSTIMHSLKRAGPLLARVAIFVLFAIILFSIVGVQSFQGSFRRTCVVADSIADAVNGIDLSQNCGSWINPDTLLPVGYVDSKNNTMTEVKGFTCPLGQICLESSANPQNGTQAFDNFFLASMQVIIVASANTWSPVMYQMMDTDFYLSFAFFIVCLVVLNFWLINLFVAVITNMFGVIRVETKKSAFGATTLEDDQKDEEKKGWRRKAPSILRVWYEWPPVQYFWAALVLLSFGLQASKTARSSPAYLAKLDQAEFYLTIAFDVDILWRSIGYLPHWREFFSKKNNNIDLVLAIASTIIQIPAIKRSEVYSWLTIFQLLRFYRVILVIPYMRPLLLRVFGNMTGLANMVLFLLLTNYLAALVAIQLLRGDLPEDADMNYSQITLSFLGMYQIFSSENWTDVLYDATASEVQFKQAIIVALFLCGWFLFANFILLQMFIAVIRENFEVAEEQKRQEQIAAYQRKIQPRVARLEWMERWNPYRFFGGSGNTEDFERDGTVKRSKSMLQRIRRSRTHARKASYVSEEDTSKGVITTLRKFFDLDEPTQDIPLGPMRKRRPTIGDGGDETQELERHLEILSATNPDDIPDDRRFQREERARKKRFIEAHPTFDKVFWIVSQQNPIRRFCQMLVTPSNGERINGRPPSSVPQALFQLVILLVVIGGICIAAVATPVYRRNYFAENGRLHLAWFDISEAAFGLVLVLEFLIKIIADGFIFTPNAYVLSVWNLFDLMILVALLANVVTSLVVIGGISRITRSLKAFRALRLITLIGRVRDTFHSVLLAGAGLIVEAAVLAMLYMLPYACWGLNIFAKRFYLCNDGNANGKADCIGEYLSTPVDNSLGFLAPRSWDLPSPSTTFSFDTFGSSLLILFEIVSLEGWIDVLVVALGLKGIDEQPGHNINQANAIFFVVYNLMGAVVILTLFVSIIIGNFSTRSGMALLTNEQRRWIDLRKLITRQRPSKRPRNRPQGVFREWCYDRAVRKHGFWSRFMTVFYVFHILVLMSQTFSNSLFTDFLRNSVFLFVTLVYAMDIIIRLSGLGWRSFKANGWNLFDIVVVVGNFATGIPIVLGSTGFMIEQLQKLFLVSIAFKLVQKSNSLNQLFKTSIASLPAIFNLFLFWLILFVFFAIVFMEVFALTRWDSGETHNQNYSSFGNALLMLAFMSTGEGWNQYMHDYTVEYPRCQNSSASEPDSDCGSAAWAYFLFISWNILSMYIFVNMFTGVVVENFSFVFQLTGEISVNREEMRAFKKIWAEYDPDRTGYIPRDRIVSFFSKLRGVFEVRLYSEQLSPRGLVEATKMNHPLIYRSTITGEEIQVPLNMRRLNAILNGVDYAQVRARRTTYNRLIHEARIVSEQRGISFTNMLLLLAHHKLINDSEALRVEEAYRRKITTDHVADLMKVDRVRSTFIMVYHRKNYLRHREALEAQRRVRSGVPAIIVEDLPSSPPHSTRDIASSNLNSPRSSFESRWSRDDATDHVWHANAQAMSTPAVGAGHKRYPSDASALSADITTSPIATPRFSQDRPTSASVSRRPSIWGDIIQAAGESKHDELGGLSPTRGD